MSDSESLVFGAVMYLVFGVCTAGFTRLFEIWDKWFKTREADFAFGFVLACFWPLVVGVAALIAIVGVVFKIVVGFRDIYRQFFPKRVEIPRATVVERKERAL